MFGTTLDLKAHVVEQHGGEMTARDRKDARRIEAAFEHDAPAESGSSNRRQGRGRGGERERETPESGQLRNRRREAFRGALTADSTAQRTSTSPQPREEDYIFPSTEASPVAAE